MSNILVLFAHPVVRHSVANSEMARRAQAVKGVTFVDLYAEYPRHNIDIEREQKRLIEHDVIVMQFPLLWYSTPSLLKEWQDLVLENGFAYGEGGDRLHGKRLMLAITAGGPETAYDPEGYNNFPLRRFLTPLEQTANLCGMVFLPPFVLFGALRARAKGGTSAHTETYGTLLEALRDDRLDFDALGERELLQAGPLPLIKGYR